MPTLLPAQSYGDSRIANALAACKSLITLHPIPCQVRPFRKKREGDTLFFGTLEGLVRRRRMRCPKRLRTIAASLGKICWTICSKFISKFLHSGRASSRTGAGRGLRHGHSTESEPPRAIRGSLGSKSPETTNWADVGSAPARRGAFPSCPIAAQSLFSVW
jgi:hypothetical protein